MGRFLFSIIFAFLGCIRAADPAFPTINLSQDNPSYALHGISLNYYQQVMINSCTSCSLIFDVTVRNVTGSIFSYDTTMLMDCLDSTLNDGIDNMTRCSWTYAKNSAILRIGSPSSYEFGISVRVREWTEDSFDIILLPVHSYFNDSIALSTSTLTVGSKNSGRGTVATSTARDPKRPFTFLLSTEVTPDSCVYDVVAGGIPAGNGNPTNLLQRVNATTNLLKTRILSTAFSIVVPAGCEAKFEVIDYNPSDWILFKPGSFFITSPNYPWVFDEGLELGNEPYTQQFLQDGYLDELTVDFWIDKVEGGSLNLELSEMTQQGTVWNVMNATFDDKTTNANLTGQVGQLLRASWQSNTGAMRKGFLLRGVAYDLRRAPTAWPITGDPTSTMPSWTSEKPGVSTSGPLITTTKISVHAFSFFSYLLIAFIFLSGNL